MKLKLSEIKKELRKMLLEMSVIKTDKAVLGYEAEELKVGTEVFIEDEEGNRTAVENGEYIAEDGTVYVVADSKIAEVVEPKEEEVVEETEPAEEVVEEVVAEETEPVEEVVEEPAVEETEPDVLAELEKRLDELEKTVAELVEKVAGFVKNTDELFEKVTKMSVAKPAAEEFEQVKTIKKSGYAKVDKFMEKYGNK